MKGSGRDRYSIGFSLDYRVKTTSKKYGKFWTY